MMSVESICRRCATLPSFPCLALSLVLGAAVASPAAAPAQTWQPVGPPASIESLAVGAAQSAVAAPGILYASLPGTRAIYHSADGGATWTRNNGLLTPPFGGFAGDINQLVADPQTPGTAYAATDAGLFKTTDGGVSWQSTPSPVGLCPITRLALAPSRPGQLYVINTRPLPDPAPPCLFGGVVSSSDGGATFSVAGEQAASPFTALAVDPANPDRIYVASPSTMLIYVSNDGGATLTALPPLPAAGEQVTGLAFDPSTTPSTLFAVVNISDPFEQAVFRAQPDGAAGSSPFWTAPASGLPVGVQVHDLAFDVGQLSTTAYAATDHGIFRSQDHGNTWAPLSDGLSSLDVTALALDPTLLGPLYAGTSAGVDVLAGKGCQPGAATACLEGSRFQVQVTFQLDGQTATAQAVELSDDTTAFWFFGAANYELLVKVLDGQSVNGDFWVFSGGLSDVEYTVTVTDVLTGAVKTYQKAAGVLLSFADTSAFPAATPAAAPPTPVRAAAGSAERSILAAPKALAATPGAAPRAAGGTCTADATDLCLLASRFQVKVAFNGGSLSGNGQAIPLTDNTGSFWFLAADNYELTVKIIDGTTVNGHFWVFYGDMTNFEFTLTVTDTTNGAVKTYQNTAGTIATVADTSAF